ncbi:GGDEF domain-containing protein [Phycisphaerales bacterium AB-hyl4]|uniref:diguanylate cyclase n=1 Tax=Natronomicrosphaera hydrolytica TaxID=3242702 RepID=A0ABV4U946_9BACT
MSRTAPLPSSATPPASTPARPRASARSRPAFPWDNAPLRSKGYAIVMIAVVGGLLLGTIEARFGHRIWPMLLGLPLMMWLGCELTNHWLNQPILRLVGRLERLARSGELTALRKLPTNRDDELGRIARAVHQLGENGIRHQNEASSLRRTLETRAAEATRRATHQLERLAMRDPLTDLGNRRCLDESLPALIAHARQSNHDDLLCIMLDIDNFKPLNDTLGHAAGDEVLVFLGSLISGCTRDDDLAVRLGGDEFVILLPVADTGRARQFAENVRCLFRQQTRTMFPDGPETDLSIGVAGLKRDVCPDGETLLARADEYLYKAKGAGKGRMRGL